MSYSLELKTKINDLIFKDYEYLKHYPNLLIYGLDDFSMNYFLEKILNNLYGELSISKSKYEIDNYNSSKNEIEIKESDYHIEFNPQSSGLDKYALMNLIRDYGQNQLVSVINNDSKRIRTIIINPIDELNYYAQASLRRNMEKYANITRFILVSNNLSKVSEPIRSRCSLIRLPKLSFDKKQFIIKTLFPKDKTSLNFEKNIEDILLDIQLNKLGLGKRKDLDNYIKDLLNIGLKIIKPKLTESGIRKLKNILYDLYISNFKLEDILLSINNNIIKLDISIDKKYEIIELLIDSNIRFNQGKRHLIHLEKLIFEVIQKL